MSARPLAARYAAREQARAMRALGDTRHLSRAAFLAALESKLVELYGERA